MGGPKFGMAQIRRPAWEWLLTDEERNLLDGIISESATEHWRSCNYCERDTADMDKPIEHDVSCPITVTRLFAKRMVAHRSKSVLR